MRMSMIMMKGWNKKDGAKIIINMTAIYVMDKNKMGKLKWKISFMKLKVSI